MTQAHRSVLTFGNDALSTPGERFNVVGVGVTVKSKVAYQPCRTKQTRVWIHVVREADSCLIILSDCVCMCATGRRLAVG